MPATEQRAVRVVMGERYVPLGFSANIAAVALVASCFVCAVLPTSWPAIRIGLPLAVVAYVGWWASDATAAAIITVLAFVLFDGFVANSQGDLSWHGAVDAWRLGALIAASASGTALGWARDRIAVQRRFAALEVWANGDPVSPVNIH